MITFDRAGRVCAQPVKEQALGLHAANGAHQSYSKPRCLPQQGDSLIVLFFCAMLLPYSSPHHLEGQHVTAPVQS